MRKGVMNTAEPASSRQANQRFVKKLDSTYAKADLKQVSNNATQLSSEEITQLLRILDDFEYLFGGIPVYCDTEPVDLVIKPYYKPFNSEYYWLPRINKENFRKEPKLLVKIGVLNLVQQSQYGTPIFIIRKKEGTLRFITDYRRLNHKLVRNTYLLPRIGKNMQQLELLQYATALYINMGYYTISLSTASNDMTTIVTEFGKFRYIFIPMGMCALGGIFQVKVDQLLGDIKVVETYIDNILVLSKEILSHYTEQQKIFFVILRAADLKVNYPKCSFG